MSRFAKYQAPRPSDTDLAKAFKARYARLQRCMEEDSVELLYLLDPGNVRYATNIARIAALENVRYRALAPQKGQPLIYANPGRDMLSLQETFGARVRPKMLWSLSPTRDEDLKRWVHQVKHDMEDLGLRKAVLAADMPLATEEAAAFAAAGIKTSVAAQTLSRSRIIKTPEEIAVIRKNAGLNDALFKIMREEIQPRMRERDLTALATAAFYELGGEIPVFTIAAGDRTNPLHTGLPSDNVMKRGDLVIIDSGGNSVGGYWVDATRTFVVGKPPTRKQKELYQRCLEVLNGIVGSVKPGATSAEVANTFPRDLVAQMLKHGSPGTDLQVHSLGLTFIDGMWITRVFSPRTNQVLEPNMYFAAEVELGEGTEGVRLEHNVLITKRAGETLDQFPIEELVSTG